MDDAFRIYVEQLRDGHIEDIHEKFSPEFLDVNEKELSFEDEVSVEGKAYLAEDVLILSFAVATLAKMPCAVCNRPVKTPVEIKDFYHAEPLEEIKTGVFNFKEVLREMILLDTPRFAECEQGNCPSRKEIAKYLKKPSAEDENPENEEEGYHPFADFDWDKTKKLK